MSLDHLNCNLEAFLHFNSFYGLEFHHLDVDDDAKVATINRIANAPSTVPGLVQDDSSVGYCSNLPGRFDSKLPQRSDIALDNRTVYHCPHLIRMKKDKVYELLLIDDTTDEPIAHPVHVHGYSFNIIDMGSHDELISGETSYADATYPPVRKDTVTLPQNGFARIRLRTVNPGYWVCFCLFPYILIDLPVFDYIFSFFTC